MNRLRSSRAAGTFIASAVTALAVVSTGPAAHAAALSTSGICNYEGAGAFDCTISISGGTAPYTVSWSGSNVSYYLYGDDFVDGNCTTGFSSTATWTVRDATGATVSSSKTFFCSKLPPK